MTEAETIAKTIAGLQRAAELLRDQGGEEEYDCADACDKAAVELSYVMRAKATTG